MVSSICRCFGSTTCTDVTQANSDVFCRVINTFPKGIQMAFAYGSGVFQQQGGDMSKNMLDFIIVVDNPVQWHEENLETNSNHYSFLKHLGAKRICSIQENYGAGIYFNTLIPFEQRLIKYGVIGTQKLVADLVHWDHLYVSGRLHKPVRIVKRPTSSEVIRSLDKNLCSALHASLLLLPETFTELELFTMITGLSYSGDFRMTFGEDKGKVLKIVTPNLEHFHTLYQPIIEKNKFVHYNENLGKFVNLHNEVTRFYNLNGLPRNALQGILKHQKNPNMHGDLEDVIRKVAKDTNTGEYVAKSVASIVNRSSWTQSVKNVPTAGVLKTIRYSYSKVKKMLKGMKK